VYICGSTLDDTRLWNESCSGIQLGCETGIRRVGRYIELLSFLVSAVLKVNDQLHAPTDLLILSKPWSALTTGQEGDWTWLRREGTAECGRRRICLLLLAKCGVGLDSDSKIQKYLLFWQNSKGRNSYNNNNNNNNNNKTGLVLKSNVNLIPTR